MIERFDRDTVLLLLNAIYFNGKWTVPFPKARTHTGRFRLLDGRHKPHPMMAQSGRYLYYRGSGFQAVSLPYGSGKISMYVFLPDQETSLAGFLRGLSAASWAAWMPQFRDLPGAITLPRFTLSTEIALNQALQALGMGIAFDERRANFTGILPPPQQAFISQVKHKTFIEVHEQGTEAAAATAVEMQATSAPLESFSMVVNRPFFFAIRDNPTGSLLFLGAVVEPQ
jgi:serpin B